LKKKTILWIVIAVLVAAGAATGTYFLGQDRGYSRGYAAGQRRGEQRASNKADRPVVMPLLIPTEATTEELLVGLGWGLERLSGVDPAAWTELCNRSPSPSGADRGDGLTLAASVLGEGGCAVCVPQAEYARDLLAAGWTVDDARRRLYRDTRLAFDPAGTTQFGPADAPVVMAWWVDFRCPYCARSFPAIQALHEAYPEQLRIDVMHLPLRMHPEADEAARATLAAHRQDAFMPLAALLFDKRKKLRKQVPDDGGVALQKMARKAGLDEGQYAQDYADEAWDAVLESHREQARTAGVRGVPAVFLNGHKVSRFSEARAREHIDALLAGDDPVLAR